MLERGGNRRVIVVRHGERIDLKFKDAWIEQCFSDGKYSRQNLNQPEELPRRKNVPQSFYKDSPLTEVGLLQATLRGQGLRSFKLLQEDFEVYASPALRCIQTASNILTAMNVKKEIKVESAFYEWTNTNWDCASPRKPQWMTEEELTEAGFLVDSNYKPLISRNDLPWDESSEDFYFRNHNGLIHLLQNSDKDLLIVAHGFSTDVATRQLLGFPPRSREEMLTICRHVPYCGMVILELEPETETWKIVPLTSQLQLTHAAANEFEASDVYYSSDKSVLHPSSVNK